MPAGTVFVSAHGEGCVYGYDGAGQEWLFRDCLSCGYGWPEQCQVAASEIPDEDRRCRRGRHCILRDRIPAGTTTGWEDCTCACHLGGPYAVCEQDGGCGLDHAEPREIHTVAGKLLDDPSAGFCYACQGRLGLALDELPALFARLALAHLPTMEITYDTEDLHPGGKLHPPIPLDEYADALARLIDHETRTAARMVADHAGVPWSSEAADGQRVGERVQQSCQLLAFRSVQWLTVGPREYRARSLTVDPQDGHGAHPVEQKAGDWWVTRDGPDQAMRVMDLWRKIKRVVGMEASDWVPTPCGYCSNRTLFRDHAICVVRCSTCGDTKTDDAHDAFVAAALAAVGAP